MAHKLSTAVKAYALNPAVHGPQKGVVRPSVPAHPAGAPAAMGGAAPPPGAAPATPMPWDSNYETSISGINRNRDTGLAGIAQEEAAAKQAYGFDDLSNPFNKIALLKQTFANSQRGNTNSMAAQGQLYSGALQNAQTATQHGYDVNYDATRREYDSVLNGLQQRRTQTQNAALDQAGGAEWDRTQTALANRTDPSTLPAPAAPAAPRRPIPRARPTRPTPRH